MLGHMRGRVGITQPALPLRDGVLISIGIMLYQEQYMPIGITMRDCWARHELHGFPAKGDKKEDWRGPWWDGYDKWHANKRAKQ